uniref:NADH:ubiquinone reductase (H(+)-translocating) n=1 Tax=Xenos vesparum TaxID=31928 RepID=B7ZE93_9NEOP|nr:NADH dehydrogenase subunit 5 [Xenos vesparum]
MVEFKISMIFLYFMFILLIMMLFNSLFIEWEIYMNESLDFGFLMIFDWLSLTFLLFLLLISLSVVIYSKSYMFNDYFKSRFVILLSLFIISMIFLIISPNVLTLMLGWDGLGLVSFCLIAFYQNSKSLNASVITFMFNRVGDSFIYLMMYFFIIVNSMNFVFFDMFFFNQIPLVCLFLACMTKSAQMPFSVWLPLAMAAPTPVSSLVHSSTLVTSGVFLLIRFNDFYLHPNFLFEILFILTLMMSSVSACLEKDLKKIIALSTLSQLSLMLLMLMEGFMEVCFLHLLIHAVFKCLLFLCSGLIIHSFNGEQDIRYMGNFVSFYPILLCYLNISFLVLMGLPFLSAFYTKDFFLEIMNLNSYGNLLVMMSVYISILLTIVYSFGLMYKLNLFFFSYSSWVVIFKDSYIKFSLFLLLILSLFIGSLFMWMISLSLEFFCLSFYFKIVFYFFFMLGILLSYVNMKNLYFQSSMFIGEVLNMNYYMNIFFYNFYKFIEKGWAEVLIGPGIYKNYGVFTFFYSYSQANKLQFYLLLFIIMVMIYIYLNSLISV